MDTLTNHVRELTPLAPAGKIVAALMSVPLSGGAANSAGWVGVNSTVNTLSPPLTGLGLLPFFSLIHPAAARMRRPELAVLLEHTQRHIVELAEGSLKVRKPARTHAVASTVAAG